MDPGEAATLGVQWALPHNSGSESLRSLLSQSQVTASAQDLSCLLPPLSYSASPASHPHPQNCIQFAELKRTAALVTSQPPDSSDMTGLVQMAVPKEGWQSCSAEATQLKALFHVRQLMRLVRHL